uniref:Uncharacterized protein n=1 Tax=Bionectria ochroleuca TaxID=29856 RepID=A0A8H7NQW2_BIOOC
MAWEIKVPEVFLRPRPSLYLARHAISSSWRVTSARRALDQGRRVFKFDPSTHQFNKNLADSDLSRTLSTRVDATTTAEEALPNAYNDLRFGPEGEVIVDMITQDDYSVARAVEAITTLTSAAASAAANSSPNDPTDIPLYYHADNVALAIHGLSRRVRHDRQSKLIDFYV